MYCFAHNRVATSAPSAADSQFGSRKPQRAPRTQSYCFAGNTLIHCLWRAFAG